MGFPYSAWYWQCSKGHKMPKRTPENKYSDPVEYLTCLNCSEKYAGQEPKKGPVRWLWQCKLCEWLVSWEKDVCHNPDCPGPGVWLVHGTKKLDGDKPTFKLQDEDELSADELEDIQDDIKNKKKHRPAPVLGCPQDCNSPHIFELKLESQEPVACCQAPYSVFADLRPRIDPHTSDPEKKGVLRWEILSGKDLAVFAESGSHTHTGDGTDPEVKLQAQGSGESFPGGKVEVACTWNYGGKKDVDKTVKRIFEIHTGTTPECPDDCRGPRRNLRIEVAAGTPCPSGHALEAILAPADPGGGEYAWRVVKGKGSFLGPNQAAAILIPELSRTKGSSKTKAVLSAGEVTVECAFTQGANPPVTAQATVAFHDITVTMSDLGGCAKVGSFVLHSAATRGVPLGGGGTIASTFHPGRIEEEFILYAGPKKGDKVFEIKDLEVDLDAGGCTACSQDAWELGLAQTWYRGARSYTYRAPGGASWVGTGIRNSVGKELRDSAKASDPKPWYNATHPKMNTASRWAGSGVTLHMYDSPDQKGIVSEKRVRLEGEDGEQSGAFTLKKVEFRERFTTFLLAKNLRSGEVHHLQAINWSIELVKAVSASQSGSGFNGTLEGKVTKQAAVAGKGSKDVFVGDGPVPKEAQRYSEGLSPFSITSIKKEDFGDPGWVSVKGKGFLKCVPFASPPWPFPDGNDPYRVVTTKVEQVGATARAVADPSFESDTSLLLQLDTGHAATKLRITLGDKSAEHDLPAGWNA